MSLILWYIGKIFVYNIKQENPNDNSTYSVYIIFIKNI